MAKFIQVCASQNDLFALDDEGNVFQYNFNTKTWVKLVASRAREEGTEPGDARARVSPPRPARPRSI